MKLRHLPYYFFILLFSCVGPTLVPDKDCAGTIGGDAVVDDCGHCTGGTSVATFNVYLGCDSSCQGTQIDCLGECGGETKTDCNGDCGGNSFTDYYCKENEDGMLLNLDSLSLECFGENENGNCRPNTNSCLYVDCEVDTMYTGTVIDCNFQLPSIEMGTCDDEGNCLNLNDYMKGDGLCDYYGPQYNFTNCKEFGFDGGDCDLEDCAGFYFSDSLCFILFEEGLCTSNENNWLGDEGCDSGDNEFLPLNFNCEKWGFDGAECICNDEDNNEYDCWNKTIPGDYSCSGIVRGGDCLDSYGRIKPNGVGFSYRKNKLSLNISKIIAGKKRIKGE